MGFGGCLWWNILLQDCISPSTFLIDCSTLIFLMLTEVSHALAQLPIIIHVIFRPISFKRVFIMYGVQFVYDNLIFICYFFVFKHSLQLLDPFQPRYQRCHIVFITFNNRFGLLLRRWRHLFSTAAVIIVSQWQPWVSDIIIKEGLLLRVIPFEAFLFAFYNYSTIAMCHASLALYVF